MTKSRHDFHNMTALVTGAGSGIGRAIALGLAESGAAVVVNDLTQEIAQPVADAIMDSGGQATVVAGNVANPTHVKAAVDTAVSVYGGLNLAMNNAGVAGPQGFVEDIDLDDYREFIDVNLNSVFYALHYEIPAIEASGGGSIVNTSSILGLVADAYSTPYVTAKHGITGMTKAAALACATRGIRVNSLHPGFVDTPILQQIPPQVRNEMMTKQPIGRLGTVDEVAAVALFLLSDESSLVTGAQYTADGGYTAT